MIKDLLIVTVFPGAMALAAASDLFTMTLPNRLALAPPLVGLGWSDVGLHVALALLALVATSALFLFGWMGGGDVKLFAATCLWLNPETLIAYSIYAGLIGMALALALVLWRKMPLPAMLSSQVWLVRLHSPNEGVPYGIALATAGLLVYPQSPFMAALGL
jgi:prepilin peptidase CpaA